MGWVTKVVQSPWLAMRARRRFSSNMGPRMKPIISGVLGSLKVLNSNPTMAKANTHITSKARLSLEKAPTQHMTIMMGSRMCLGMSSSLVNTGRPSRSKMTMKMVDTIRAR